jgi:hypothetical protein
MSKIFYSLIFQLERTHSRLADYSAIWFPFVFLRPAPHVSISFIHSLKMVLCFGTYFLIFYFFKKLVFANPFVWSHALMDGAIYGYVGFFVWFRLVTIPLWNMRARRLGSP